MKTDLCNALFRDNTARVMDESSMMEMYGDKWNFQHFPEPDGKPKFKPGQSVMFGSSRVTVAAIVRHENGYNQYVIETPNCKPFLCDGDWFIKTKRGEQFATLIAERNLSA